ncbi:MAG TPA: hypothetical protein VMB80_03705 [Candidatus Acidoferrum sp.]|nr:hypothetical protein [Candidatus Acidoferrum sp.]
MYETLRREDKPEMRSVAKDFVSGAPAKIWSAVAERSNDTAFLWIELSESGVAPLRGIPAAVQNASRHPCLSVFIRGDFLTREATNGVSLAKKVRVSRDG